MNGDMTQNAFVAPNVTASHMEDQENKNRVSSRGEFFGEKIEAYYAAQFQFWTLPGALK